MRRFILFVAFTILGVWLSLSLGGCASGNFETPIKPQYRKESVAVTWIETDNIKAVCNNNRAIACAIPELEPCLVWTYPNPDWGTLGHEIGHCFLGRWHE